MIDLNTMVKEEIYDELINDYANASATVANFINYGKYLTNMDGEEGAEAIRTSKLFVGANIIIDELYQIGIVPMMSIGNLFTDIHMLDAISILRTNYDVYHLAKILPSIDTDDLEILRKLLQSDTIPDNLLSTTNDIFLSKYELENPEINNFLVDELFVGHLSAILTAPIIQEDDTDDTIAVTQLQINRYNFIINKVATAINKNVIAKDTNINSKMILNPQDLTSVDIRADLNPIISYGIPKVIEHRKTSKHHLEYYKVNNVTPSRFAIVVILADILYYNSTIKIEGIITAIQKVGLDESFIIVNDIENIFNIIK